MGEVWHSEVRTANPPSGERFCSVEFLHEEGSIAAVPLIWTKNRRIGKINGEHAVVGKCYWPPKSMNSRVQALASKQVQPERLTWDLYDVALLKYGSTFAECRKSLVELSGKENEADPDDSSDDDLVKARRDKSKLRKRRLSHSDQSESDEESLFDSSKLISNKEAGPSSDGSSLIHPSGTESEKSNRSPQKKVGFSKVMSPKKGLVGKVTSPRKQGENAPSAAKSKSPSKASDRAGNGERSPHKLSAPSGSSQKEQIQDEPKTPLKTNTRARTPQKGAQAQPCKTPVKSNSPKPTRVEDGFPPLKQTISTFVLSPNKEVRAEDEMPNLMLNLFQTQKRNKPPKQSHMSDYVSSITDRELAEIEDDIQQLQSTASPASTCGSARSASPSISECSEASIFKTPQEKSAYRALSFSSPSQASSFRLLQSLITDGNRDLGRQLRSLEEAVRSATGSIQKILSCVLPPLETNIAEDLPRLPLEEKEGERKLNDLLKQKEQFNKVVTFLHGLGGTCARDAVFSAMKTLFTDEFASTKSMKGIKRSGKPTKDAFMGTPLFKAVMCAVRRRFREATVSEVMEMTGNWLKDAPARERKRQRRKESRERALQEYEEDFDQPA